MEFFSWWPLSFAVTMLLITTALAAFILDPLISLIINPIIIRFPWKHSDDPVVRERDTKRVVVLAGSYNPPHRGHLAMLEYLAERYGKVMVVIGMNPDKKYDVSPNQRAELTRKMLQGCKGCEKIEVKVVQGYIWRTVKREGAEIFFRGIRSWEKDGSEERALQILNTWGPLVLGPLWWPIPTLFLEGNPEFNHVSSTVVRDICQNAKGNYAKLEELVPKSIVKDVASMYGPKKTKGS